MAKKKKAKGSPFGEASRGELLEQHPDAFGAITPATAWRFVYEELLWFDRSTGLVHLYERDKVRPGRVLVVRAEHRLHGAALPTLRRRSRRVEESDRPAVSRLP